MAHLLRVSRAFLHDDDGPTTTEYAVICALLVIAAMFAIRALGGGVEGKWQRNADQIITTISG